MFHNAYVHHAHPDPHFPARCGWSRVLRDPGLVPLLSVRARSGQGHNGFGGGALDRALDTRRLDYWEGRLSTAPPSSTNCSVQGMQGMLIHQVRQTRSRDAEVLVKDRQRKRSHEQSTYERFIRPAMTVNPACFTSRGASAEAHTVLSPSLGRHCLASLVSRSSHACSARSRSGMSTKTPCVHQAM